MNDCPKCGLTNPVNAQRCDCGFDFLSKKVEASYLSEQELTDIQRRTKSDVLGYVAKGVPFVVVVLAFSVTGAAFPDGWGRRVLLFVVLVTAWTGANICGPKLRQLLKGKRSQQK